MCGGNAPAYEDLVCRTGEAKSKAAVCRSSAVQADAVNVACEPSVKNGGKNRLYVCSPKVRDWSQPSPYAHTSRIWLCVHEEANIHLFDSDFSDDGLRCDLLCGRCEGRWQKMP